MTKQFIDENINVAYAYNIYVIQQVKNINQFNYIVMYRYLIL